VVQVVRKVVVEVPELQVDADTGVAGEADWPMATTLQ
jgi:hypothetical protein